MNSPSFLLSTLFVFLLMPSSLYGSWQTAYEQEEKAYYNLEQDLLAKYGTAESKTQLSLIISGLKEKGSLFYLDKYLQKEFELGIRDREHFIWHLDIFIKINDIAKLSRVISKWKDEKLLKELTEEEKQFYSYAKFVSDVNEDDLSSKTIKSLLNTKFHDKVISRVLLRKVYAENRDYEAIKRILSQKKKLLYEDKMILAILGECQSMGKDFQQYCKIRGDKLERVQKSYPEVELLQHLYVVRKIIVD